MPQSAVYHCEDSGLLSGSKYLNDNIKWFEKVELYRAHGSNDKF
jgi:hypothetical protein